MGKGRRKAKIKVVFDTNIWVSLLLDKQLARSLLPSLNNGQVVIFMSHQILTELARVLTYPKINEILQKSNVDPRVALGSIVKKVTLVSISEGTVNYVMSDPSDNRILECAQYSKAKYVVTGDRHLLELKYLNRIKIIRAREFANMLNRP